MKREFVHARSYPLLLILAAILALWVGKWWANKDLQIEKLRSSNTNSFLSGQLQTTSNELQRTQRDFERHKSDAATSMAQLKSDHSEELRKQDVEILKLLGEKDAAQQRVALFEAMPANLLAIYTNLTANAPTNLPQFQNTITALTNALAAASLAPSFDLYLNSARVTNGTVVSLRTTRELRVAAHNVSEMTADNLVIVLEAPLGLDPTNVIADGWTPQPPSTLKTPETLLTNITGHRWLWQADTPVAASSIYHAASLRFSTNISYPVIGVEFTAFSSKSKTHRYHVNLLFQ